MKTHLVLMAWCLSGAVTGSAQSLIWTNANLPPITANNWWGIAEGPEELVAVGHNGAIARSTDGVNWSFHPVESTYDLFAVTSGHNGYVAVGYGGRSLILRSADGMQWTTEYAKTGSGLVDVASGNGRYVASGFEGELLLSADGSNWMPTGPHLNGDAHALAFLFGTFVAFTPWEMLRSVDGLRWSSTPHSLGSVEKLTFGDGQYVLVSSEGIITSPDLRSFSIYRNPQLGPLLSVSVGNGVWLAVGPEKSASSVDRGKTWLLHDETARDVLFARDRFITSRLDHSQIVPWISTRPFYTFNRTTGELLLLAPQSHLGTNITVEVSYDVKSWQEARGVLTNDNGTLKVLLQTRDAESMFFRSRSQNRR